MDELKRDISQLWLLLWKNFRLQLRSPMGLLLEMLAPVLLALILVPIRKSTYSVPFKSATIYPSFEIDYLPIQLTGINIAYQPNNSALVNEIMRKVGKKLDLTPIG